MKQFLMATVLTLSFLASFAQAEDRLIIVNGVAEKGLDPNMVQIELGVWSKAGTAKQAQGLAAEAFTQLRKTFDTFKLKKEDIQTTGYNLSPDYEYDEKARRNKLVGYQVNQTLSVVLRNVGDTGNFLDAVSSDKKTNSSGVNVASLNWDSDKRAPATQAALGDAVRAAKLKAEEIAKAAGVKIKNVSKISHTTQERGPIMRTFSAAAEMKSSGTAVEAGQVMVRVEVQAEYEIN